jgi:3-dehydroquinate synthase
MAAGLPKAEAQRVLDCLADLGYELDCPQLHDEAALLAGMEEFRQHLGGRLTLTMLAGIGRPIDVHEVNRNVMHQAIGKVRAYQSARQHKPAVRAN